MAPNQSKTLGSAGGAMRNNRKAAPKPRVSTNSGPRLVDAKDFDASKLSWQVPHTIGQGATGFSFASYEGKSFHLIIDGARVTGKVTEFEKPSGGSKHTFGISIEGLGAVGALALCDSVSELENQPNLADYLGHGVELGKVSTPLWGDEDKPALNLEVDPTKVRVLDGTLDDVLGGAVVRVAINPSVWLHPEADSPVDKMNVGLKFKAVSIRILEKRVDAEVDWDKYNPARHLRRNVRSTLPYPIMEGVVDANTDFGTAVAFFKMGYPLATCMRGVGWPQNRYELPAALFMPDPVRQSGCAACNKIWSKCRCGIREYERGSVSKAHGVPDESGTLWPYFTQSMEDGFNGETYLVRHWSDEYDEWSLATALNGEDVAGQLRSLRTEYVRFWKPADPMCFCEHVGPLPEHDAWEKCSFAFAIIEDEEPM